VSGNEFDKLAGDSPTTRGDESSARLEARVSELTSKIAEERFIWSLVVLVLFDCFAFEKMTTWGAPLAVFGVEIVLMLVIARRCGVQDIVLLLDRVLLLWNPSRTRNRDASP
jgi:hypothetical protein